VFKLLCIRIELIIWMRRMVRKGSMGRMRRMEWMGRMRRVELMGNMRRMEWMEIDEKDRMDG